MFEYILKYNVIPNFLPFRVINKTLKDSLTYSRCQHLLLYEEIRMTGDVYVS